MDGAKGRGLPKARKLCSIPGKGPMRGQDRAPRMSKHGDMQVKPQLYQYRTGDLLGWVRREDAEIGPLRG